jgi:hypothetical protein
VNSQKAVNSQRVLETVRVIYDEVNLALWAVAVAMIVYIVAVILPQAPQVRAQAELLRTRQINAENEWYCARWHMGPGAAMHSQCVSDLQQLRTSIENRLADENDI